MGADFYRKAILEGDQATITSPKMVEAFDILRKSQSYFDPGIAGRPWNLAAAMVIEGKAGILFMGDWAKGEFTAAGQTAGKEYGCTLVGEGGGKLVIGGDVFVFPVVKDKAQLAAQDKLVQIVHDPVSQLEFNKKKGSIPVRQDVDTSSMDACAQKASAALKDPANQVESMELLATPNFVGAMQDAVTQFWNNQSVTADAFVEKVVAAIQSAS
jgi:glucose/mannose transport system substrate-binding protein